MSLQAGMRFQILNGYYDVKLDASNRLHVIEVSSNPNVIRTRAGIIVSNILNSVGMTVASISGCTIYDKDKTILDVNFKTQKIRKIATLDRRVDKHFYSMMVGLPATSYL